MTMLSQYLQAESLDRTEPASFYLPGAEAWDRTRGGYFARHRAATSADDPSEPAPDIESIKIAE